MSRSRVARSLAIWPWGWPAEIAAPASVASVVPATRAAALARRDDFVGLRAARAASIDVCIVCLPMCRNVMLGEVVAQARPSPPVKAALEGAVERDDPRVVEGQDLG